MSVTSDPMDLTPLDTSTTPTSPINTSPTDARFWARVYANLVDTSILVLITLLLTTISNIIFIYYQFKSYNSLLNLEKNIAISSTVFVLVSGYLLKFIYYIYYLSSADQATPGMKLHDLKLVDRQGDRVTLRRVIIRELMSIVSFWALFIGYLMILMTKRRQALHDLVTGTYVQDISKPLNIDAALSQQCSQYTYGGFWQRLGAVIADKIILEVFVILIIVLMITIQYFAANPLKIGTVHYVIYSIMAFLFFFIFPFLYWVYFICSKYQATPGKALFSLKVVDCDGKKLTVFKAFVYCSTYYYSAFIFGIGFIMAAFTKRKQGFHNKISRTFVIHVPKKATSKNR